MKKTIPESQSSYERFAIILIWIGIVIILITTVLFSFNNTLEIMQKHFGQYGEYVGGLVGALWSLASVLLFYEALLFQRNELKMQRHELELQRHEIIEQTEQYRMQNETLSQQMFENTFFQLLTLHNEIVNSINIELEEHSFGISQPQKLGTSNLIRGRDCFVEFYNYFKFIYMDTVELMSVTNPSNDDYLNIINESFDRFYYMYQEHLGHYFRNLYNLVKFIDRSEIKNKTFYTNLVHAHLSNFELILLFYSNLSNIGTNFKPLVEKYSILINLPEMELIDIRHKELYDEKAYKQTV